MRSIGQTKSYLLVCSGNPYFTPFTLTNAARFDLEWIVD